MKTNYLTAAVIGRRADVLAMLATMQLEHVIICKAGQHGAKIYSLPL